MDENSLRTQVIIMLKIEEIRIIEKITQMLTDMNLSFKIFLKGDFVSCLCAYVIY